MANKLTVTVSFTVIFTLFIFCNARIPLTEPSTTSSDTNNKEFLQTIRLPSEKTEEDPDTMAISVTDLPETDTNTITTIGIGQPLTITYDVSFRPINPHVHHLHMKHPFSYRFPHPCRHHGKKTVGGPREISYGNDMIMSSQNGRSDRVGGYRQFKPMRGYKVNGEWLTKKDLWKLRERHVDGSDQIVVKETEESGLLKKFRKFLNHF